MAEKVVTTRDINIAIKQQIAKSKKVKISGLSGQDSIAVGLEKEIDINVKGNAGDFFGALNKRAIITLEGNARRFLGDTISGGGIIVNGNVRHGAGLCMHGGIIVIRGEAQGDIGQLNKAGTVIVSEDAGEKVGALMFGGEIIIAGDVGEKLGDWMVGGSIYVGGEISSMGNNTKIVDLRPSEQDKLQTYFRHYGIKSQPAEFRKIVAEDPQIDRVSVFKPEVQLPESIEPNHRKHNPTLEDLAIVTPQVRPPNPVDFLHEEIQTEVTIGTDKVIKPLKLNMPIFLAPPSFGDVGLSTKMAFAYGASLTGTATNTADGGSFKDELDICQKHGGTLISHWTTGRFGIDVDYLKNSNAIEIKIGGWKGTRIPEILPALKNTPEIAEARNVPENIELISPLKHLDIDRPPDLKKHVELLREITDYRLPIIIRIGAGRVYEDTRLAVRAGADAVAIEVNDSYFNIFSTPLAARAVGNLNLPDLAALAAARRAMENIPSSQKRKVKILMIGGFKNGAEIYKILALGADAVGITTPALIAIGCTECGKCDSNECEAGIATLNPSLELKLDWIEAGKKLMGFINNINNELKILTGLMGYNEINRITLEDLRGLNYDTAALAGVKLAGYARRLPMWEH